MGDIDVGDAGMRAGPWLPSPVPADADLDEGEAPFTAFAQWGEGRMDLRVLDQSEWWVDRTGTPHALITMSAEHVDAVVNALTVNARRLHADVMRRLMIEVLYDAATGRPNADVLAVAAGDPAPLPDLGPGQWLEATPLMRRLRRLQADV